MSLSKFLGNGGIGTTPIQKFLNGRRGPVGDGVTREEAAADIQAIAPSLPGPTRDALEQNFQLANLTAQTGNQLSQRTRPGLQGGGLISGGGQSGLAQLVHKLFHGNSNIPGKPGVDKFDFRSDSTTRINDPEVIASIKFLGGQSSGSVLARKQFNA